MHDVVNGLVIGLLSVCLNFWVGILYNARVRVALIGAVIGGIGYGLFLLIPSPMMGYFIAALVLTLLAEIGARLWKVPTTALIVIGIHTLVPGVGIYRAARCILASDYPQALAVGGETLVFLAMMAVGMALVSALFSRSWRPGRRRAGPTAEQPLPGTTVLYTCDEGTPAVLESETDSPPAQADERTR